MNEKENYLKVLNKEQPEWVPIFQDAVDLIPPAISIMYMATEEKIDYLGVHWLVNDAGAIADTTVPPVLKDISDWKKFVNLPDPDNFDWEGFVAKDLENHDPNKALALIIGVGGGSFFIPLMNMMGFEEGLCALIESPNEVKELFDCLMAWYEKVFPLCIKYYKPDVIVTGDDLCTARGAFISMDTYKELFKPYYVRIINMVHEAGIKFEFHMCGKAEPFIEDLVAEGIDSWQPAQGINDLAGLKAKYGNELIFNGTWSTGGPAGVPNAPEETVRREVRNCIDTLATGGGMIFWNGDPVGSSTDQLQKMDWLNDEARKYGRKFYAI